MGDAKIEMNKDFFKYANLLNLGVDVLFLEYFDTSVNTKKFINNFIQPERKIFMHYQKLDGLNASVRKQLK